MKRKTVLFVIPLVILITLSCEKETFNPVSDQKSGENAGHGGALKITGAGEYNVENLDDSDSNALSKCIILQELPDWPTAFFVTERATIRNDVITFVLSYTGGCRIHEFQLVCATFQESQPVQVLAQVFHTDNEDPCDQWITEVREFDLTPLKELYFDLYDTPCGQIVINLIDAAPQESPDTYRFCKEDPAVPLEPPLLPVYKLPDEIN